MSRTSPAIKFKAVTVSDREIHVVPVKDAIHHTMDTNCICGPQVVPAYDADSHYDGDVVSHPSLDGREVDDRSDHV